MRLKIELGDRLILDGLDMRFAGRRGEALDWVSDRTLERRELTDGELADAVEDGRAKILKFDPILGAEDRPVIDVGEKTPAEYREASRKLAYAEGALAAYEDGKLKQDNLEDAIKKIARKIGDKSPPSGRSVRRWVAHGGAHPVLGMFFENHKGKGHRGCKLVPEVEDILEEILDIYDETMERLSPSAIADLVNGNIATRNDDRVNKLALISRKAVAAAIARRCPRRRMAARHGEAAAVNTFDAVERQSETVAPLDVVEIDHTVCDIIVVDDVSGLPLGRPTIAFAIDRCTRMVVGFHIGFDPPSIHTVMQCLRNAISRKTYVKDKIRSGEWKIKNEWKTGGAIMRAIFIDRAMENISESLAQWALRLKVNVLVAARRTPRQKGKVERFIRTFSKGFLHQQKGTTFSNVLMRGEYNSRQRAIVPFSRLHYGIHKWIIDDYHVRPHKGFFVRDVPLRLWDELTKRYPLNPIGDFSEIEHLFGRTERRKLHVTGMTWRYIEYTSDELVAQLRDPAFIKACPDRMLTFTMNEGDISAVHVYLPHKQMWLRVPAAKRWREYVAGLHRASHLSIVAFRNERTANSYDPQELAKTKVELMEIISADLSAAGLKGRSRAARQAGIGLLALTETSTSTTTANSLQAARQRVAVGTGGTGGRRRQPAKASKMAPTAARPMAKVLAHDVTGDWDPSAPFDPYAAARQA